MKTIWKFTDSLPRDRANGWRSVEGRADWQGSGAPGEPMPTTDHTGTGRGSSPAVVNESVGGRYGGAA